jgi:NAD(P)-dependent dehydrogenase (short-subunit alcohol dehydrogenase family)
MRTVQELMSLEGRAALITGGAGHIGRAIADAFLEAGGTVALADYRTPEDQQLKKARTSFLAVDLQDESATRELAARAARTMGRLDILVHCAALVGTDDLAGWAVPLPQQSTEAWDRAMRVNLTAAFTLAQTARPFLEQSGG